MIAYFFYFIICSGPNNSSVYWFHNGHSNLGKALASNVYVGQIFGPDNDSCHIVDGFYLKEHGVLGWQR
jgi:hypothetical protein